MLRAWLPGLHASVSIWKLATLASHKVIIDETSGLILDGSAASSLNASATTSEAAAATKDAPAATTDTPPASGETAEATREETGVLVSHRVEDTCLAGDAASQYTDFEEHAAASDCHNAATDERAEAAAKPPQSEEVVVAEPQKMGRERSDTTSSDSTVTSDASGTSSVGSGATTDTNVSDFDVAVEKTVEKKEEEGEKEMGFAEWELKWNEGENGVLGDCACEVGSYAEYACAPICFWAGQPKKEGKKKEMKSPPKYGLVLKAKTTLGSILADEIAREVEKKKKIEQERKAKRIERRTREEREKARTAAFLAARKL